MKQSLFAILIMTALLWSCADNQQKKVVTQEYPTFVKDSSWVELYTQVKWAYYKYYQNCEVDIVSSKYDPQTNHSHKVKHYSKPFFCHEVFSYAYCRGDRYKCGIHFNVNIPYSRSDSTPYATADQVYCVANRELDSPLYGFYFDDSTQKVVYIEYEDNSFIDDKNFINNVLNSPDDEFVAKLLAHQDSITPWLKTELILRGYLKQ
jgi:hypothetical protein